MCSGRLNVLLYRLELLSLPSIGRGRRNNAVVHIGCTSVLIYYTNSSEKLIHVVRECTCVSTYLFVDPVSFSYSEFPLWQ